MKYQTMRNQIGRTLRLLRNSLSRLPEIAHEPARRVLEEQPRLLQLVEPLAQRKLTGLRIRTHGDYHLEQILHRGKDLIIIDFDGVATETLAERRRRHSCLRDVASMIDSFQYVALDAWLDGAVVRPE